MLVHSYYVYRVWVVQWGGRELRTARTGLPLCMRGGEEEQMAQLAVAAFRSHGVSKMFLLYNVLRYLCFFVAVFLDAILCLLFYVKLLHLISKQSKIKKFQSILQIFLTS